MCPSKHCWHCSSELLYYKVYAPAPRPPSSSTCAATPTPFARLDTGTRKTVQIASHWLGVIPVHCISVSLSLPQTSAAGVSFSTQACREFLCGCWLQCWLPLTTGHSQTHKSLEKNTAHTNGLANTMQRTTFLVGDRMQPCNHTNGVSAAVRLRGQCIQPILCFAAACSLDTAPLGPLHRVT